MLTALMISASKKDVQTTKRGQLRLASTDEARVQSHPTPFLPR